MKTGLYFVASQKHGEPQALQTGPYLSWEDANEHIMSRREPKRYCVVQTVLEFEKVTYP